MGDIRIERLAPGFYEVEERGVLFTVADQGDGVWAVWRMEHDEVFVTKTLGRNLAFQACVDNAAMLYRQNVVAAAIEKVELTDLTKLVNGEGWRS